MFMHAGAHNEKERLTLNTAREPTFLLSAMTKYGSTCLPPTNHNLHTHVAVHAHVNKLVRTT